MTEAKKDETPPPLEVRLMSGSTLKIQIAPYDVAKNLFQALLRGLKTIPVNETVDHTALFKDLFCTALSSPEIEAWVTKCFERCTIDNVKFDANTFEPVNRREDYIQVFMAVGKANVFPFMKSLYAEFGTYLKMVENVRV